MAKRRRHPSHYLERTLYSAFIALFAISAFLLLLNIDSFTGWASLHTAQVADSCAETLQPSLPCSERFDTCSEGYKKEYVMTRKGSALCCCMPPPEITIAVP